MDINSILGGVKCSCGKTHKCNIDSVYIENGAISHLEEICKTYENILIVADENTFGAAGTKVEDALLGKSIRKSTKTAARLMSSASAGVFPRISWVQLTAAAATSRIRSIKSPLIGRKFA